MAPSSAGCEADGAELRHCLDARSRAHGRTAGHLRSLRKREAVIAECGCPMVLGRGQQPPEHHT